MKARALIIERPHRTLSIDRTAEPSSRVTIDRGSAQQIVIERNGLPGLPGITGQAGAPGIQGLQGQKGEDSVNFDPGDFTIIFENQLI